MKNILVIGSNSFSGSSFTDYILKKKIKVYGVSRSFEPNDYFLKYKKNKYHKKLFKFFKFDLNKDTKKIVDLINFYKIENIVNFAAQGMVAQSWQNPIHWYQTNIISQVKLLDEISKIKFIKKYINFSTPEVYGNTNGLIKENFNFNPSTPYAISRAAFDFHLKSYYEAYKFPVIFTRAANVYGPNQQLYRVIPKAIISLKTGRKFYLEGGGISKRSFVYIDDVSDAIFKILKKGTISTTYHISDKKIISIKDLVKQICKILDKNYQLSVEIISDRLGKDHTYSLNSKRLNKELDWSPKVDLKNGLSKTINWIDKNFGTISSYPLVYKHKK